MQEELLKFIQKEIPDLHKILTTDLSELRCEAEKMTREQQFMDAVKTVKNLRVKLFAAICQAEQSRTAERVREVVRVAALQDDFVTALYWHEKLGASDLAVKFERQYYTHMAAAQKKKDEKAEPIKSSQQMLQHKSEVSAELGNEEYQKAETKYRIEELETLQNHFLSDDYEKKDLAPVLKKKKRVDQIMSKLMWVGIILDFIFLWKTVPVVWVWAKHNFFPDLIFHLLFWAVPILYAVFAGFITLGLLGHIVSKGDRLLKNVLIQHQRQITERIRASADYQAFQKRKAQLPDEYQSYGKRLVLAALSAIYGEKDLDKLLKLTDEGNPQTWLYYDAYYWSARPNSKVMSLLKEGCSDADRAYAYAVYVRTLDDPEKDPSSNSQREGYYGSSDFMAQVCSGASTMHREHAYRFQSSKPFNHLYGFLFDFLKRELTLAERSYDQRLVGEICYWIYNYAKSARVSSFVYGGPEEINYYTDMAYTYGCYGVSHSDKLKFYVMKNEAVEPAGRRNYKLSLGFDRDSARAYMETLRSKGDHRWIELRDALDSAEKEEEEREERATELAERAEKARQQIIQETRERELREQLASKADRIERDLDMLQGGSGYTQEEQLLRGTISEAEYQRRKELRDRAIEKKVKNS